MRWAVLLGIVLVSIPLVLRAPSADPYPDDASYAFLAANDDGAIGPVLDAVPPQLLIVIAATAFLLIIAGAGAGESTIALLVTAPAFLATFTTVGENALGAVLVATGLVLLIHKRVWAVALVPACFLISPTTGILGSLVFIITCIVNGLPFVALGISFFALLSSGALALLGMGGTIGIADPRELYGDLLLGGSGGVTLYLLVLGVLGYILAYLESKEPVAFTPLILLVLAPLFTGGGLVVAGTLAYGGGIAWKFLTEREWRFEELGSITLIVIACSVLFTGIVTVRERADIDEDRIALRTFVREGIGEGERVALDAPVAGALAMEGIATGEPTIPSDGSFVAGALANEGYAYIVSDHPRPHYRHFPVVFTTDSPTTYTIYEVPRR